MPQQDDHPQEEADPSGYESSEDEWAAAPRSELVDRGPQARQVDFSAMDEDERALAGGVATLRFSFSGPGAAACPQNYQQDFVMGQTIEYVKLQLEELANAPYHKTMLFMNGKRLIDPLSLNDLPFQAGALHEVQVEVSL